MAYDSTATLVKVLTDLTNAGYTCYKKSDDEGLVISKHGHVVTLYTHIAYGPNRERGITLLLHYLNTQKLDRCTVDCWGNPFKSLTPVKFEECVTKMEKNVVDARKYRHTEFPDVNKVIASMQKQGISPYVSVFVGKTGTDASKVVKRPYKGLRLRAGETYILELSQAGKIKSMPIKSKSLALSLAKNGKSEGMTLSSFRVEGQGYRHFYTEDFGKEFKAL